jgi:hypothetical protein
VDALSEVPLQLTEWSIFAATPVITSVGHNMGWQVGLMQTFFRIFVVRKIMRLGRVTIEELVVRSTLLALELLSRWSKHGWRQAAKQVMPLRKTLMDISKKASDFWTELFIEVSDGVLQRPIYIQLSGAEMFKSNLALLLPK